MNFIKENAVALVAVVIAIIALVGGGSSVQKSLFGSTACSNITCLSGGLRLVSDTGGTFESDVAAFASSTLQVTGATTLYGSLTMATSNSATSTLKAGCIQTVATSTATPIKLTFTVSQTATTSTSGSAIGFVVWQFGTCP